MVFKDSERALVNGNAMEADNEYNWLATCQGKIYEKKNPLDGFLHNLSLFLVFTFFTSIV